MNRAEKQQEIELLSKCFSDAEVAICADYRGLNVEQITSLRRELRKMGASCRVVKNTLAKLAVKEVFKSESSEELEKFIELFGGPNFVIFGKDDVVESAKMAEKFAKDFEHLKLKGAWFEGQFLDQKGVSQFAKMASKEETLGKLLNLMSTPATQLVRLLQAPAQQLVQVLNAHKENLENK